ncbi:MAG: hypothetical protein HOY76_36210 [Streptomyces sp.]|nr:hypothetical protein [Streptomyces sp.]NUS75782.1 hypothetical protein [Streptomyces sp.]
MSRIDRAPKPTLDFNSRRVQRWLERKVKESIIRSVREMTEQLRAEQAARIQSGK